MLNLNAWELLIIVLLFVLLFGPERLPEIASQLGRGLRDLRRVTDAATSELRRELELASRDMASAPPRPTAQDAGAASDPTPTRTPEPSPPVAPPSIFEPEPPRSHDAPAGTARGDEGA